MILGSWPAVIATHTACPVGIESSPSSGLTDLHVASTLSYLRGGDCGGGQEFYSEAPNCPPPPRDIVSVNGAYCGPVIGAAGQALCKWAPVGSPSVPTGLFVGFDWNNDGRLSSDTELAWGPMEQDTFYAVVNSGVSAALIAFPTRTVGTGTAPLDESIIGCTVL